LTWEQIVSIEPRLGTLAERASRENVSANNMDMLWSDKYKPALTELVGFNVNTELGTSEAYEVAVKNICDCLGY